MPTYEYRCPDGHDFERFYRKISDAEGQVACPQCGQVSERRMSIGGGFAFKGSGFYLTDYGKNAHRSSAPMKAEKGGEGGSGDSSSKDAAAPSTTSASSEGGSSGSAATAPSGDSKPTAESKPAAAKAVESKPAPTGGSATKKDK